jgi:N-acetylmuramoyl-L-alanine amidase
VRRAFLLGLLGLLSASLSAAPEEKRVAVFSVVANYTLPVAERDGRDYVGLLELLEPLGTVSAQVSGTHWKLRYNDTEAEFAAGSGHLRIQARDLDLGSNFLLEKGRGLVPLSWLGNLLPAILGGPVNFHENSRRLYIGSAEVHFTAQMSSANPPALTMSFTSPVNPRIATEPGRVQMLFTREPLVPPSTPTLTFDSKTIPSATYQESNGAAEIIVNARAPLFASFSDNGRTITLSTVAQMKPPEPAAAAAPAEAEKATPPPAASGAPPPAPQAPVVAKPASVFVVVDAGHGGDERGATLSDQLAEKDVTLDLARRLREALEAKGMPTVVLRDGDNSLTVDQRANLTNQDHPKVYLSLHASSMGKGVRLYTGWLPPSTGAGSGPFLNWDTAQAGFLAQSQMVAVNLLRDLRSAHIAARLLQAPLRPLNNIASVAVAVEIAPSTGELASINSPEYQKSVAESIASSLAALRSRLEAGP